MASLVKRLRAARPQRSAGGLFAFRMASLAVLLALLLAGLPAPAAAQGLGWFGNLFGGFPRPNPGAPAYPGYGSDGYAPRSPYDPSYARPHRRAVRRAPVEQPPAREAPKPPAKNASLFVVVLGDSLGQMLGQGLDEAMADRSDVAVVQKARSATGLVADSYYDWPKAIGELLGSRKAAEAKSAEGKPGDGKADAKSSEAKSSEAKSAEAKSSEAKPAESKSAAGKPAASKPSDAKAPAHEKIDVAVMMIGINDNQPLTVDGRVLQPGTAEWTAAYAKRVTAIDEAFHSRGIPLIWVGVPITKDDGFADAMAGLNDVYREAAAKTGATYVDTWEAFSDDNGNFAAYGPDVNGQLARLRAADGIHFTRAGARKLAHFVEVHVRHALEDKMPAPQLPVEVSDGKAKADVAKADGAKSDGSKSDRAGTDRAGADGKDGAGRQAVAHPDVGPIRNLNEAPAAANGTLAALDPHPPASAGAAETGDPARPPAGAGDAVPIGRADNARWSGDARAEP